MRGLPRTSGFRRGSGIQLLPPVSARVRVHARVHAPSVGDGPHLGHRQAAPQQGFLAVGKPFLDDLIPADRLFPHGFGHVVPVRLAIEINVQTGSRRSEIGLTP